MNARLCRRRRPDLLFNRNSYNAGIITARAVFISTRNYSYCVARRALSAKRRRQTKDGHESHARLKELLLCVAIVCTADDNDTGVCRRARFFFLILLFFYASREINPFLIELGRRINASRCVRVRVAATIDIQEFTLPKLANNAEQFVLCQYGITYCCINSISKKTTRMYKTKKHNNEKLFRLVGNSCPHTPRRGGFQREAVEAVM